MTPCDARVEAARQLRVLLAALRAQYWSYQQSHWVTRGGSFYGNHLLFERLYESVREQTDVLAEKMVGRYGGDAVSDPSLRDIFNKLVTRWDTTQCLHQRGIISEHDVQNIIKSVYDNLKMLEQLSLGMDDFLMATASEHETNQYLLRQVLRNKGLR